MNYQSYQNGNVPIVRNFDDHDTEDNQDWSFTKLPFLQGSSDDDDSMYDSFSFLKKKKNNTDNNNNTQEHKDSSDTSTSSCFAVVHRFISWLEADQQYDEPNTTTLSRSHWTMAGWIRYFIYDPTIGELCQTSYYSFTFTWIIGIIMAIFVTLFKPTIEFGMEFIYGTIPEYLAEHYDESSIVKDYLYLYPLVIMTLLGGISAHGFGLRSAMPDQNTLLDDLRGPNGGPAYSEYWHLITLSVLGMWSGQSLGPELPLLISSAMMGSWICETAKLKKSEDKRLVVLMAQSAAISAFFKLPVGGALFVNELPCRTGPIQIDASFVLSILASIIATAIHCLISDEPVGDALFNFPDLPEAFPSWIYLPVVGLALFGMLVGIFYLKMVKYWKVYEHDLVDVFEPSNVSQPCETPFNEGNRWMQFITRCLPGLASGIICLILPHCFSWGEGQLQTLIDGKTELPFFGKDSPISSPYAICLPDNNGLSDGCLLIIPFFKMVQIGLSLGSGMRCGHFWGPLFVGGSFGQLLWRQMPNVHQSYLSVGMLCTMAAAHVVTFRSYLGITTILTQVSGEYHHVFVAICAAAVISTILSQEYVFYSAQKDHHTMFTNRRNKNNDIETFSTSITNIDDISLSEMESSV